MFFLGFLRLSLSARSNKSVINNFEPFSDNDKVEILLHGDSHLDNNKNKYILEAI